MKPIIKWVGGKLGSIQIIKEMSPPTYNRYYEPFLGGGAVLLELNPKEAYVNDGPVLKRSVPDSRGRIAKNDHRTSHITVIVAER